MLTRVRSVFVDSAFYIASLLPTDTLHGLARSYEASMSAVRFVTSDAVLVEVLAHVSAMGASTRAAAALLVRELLETTEVTVVRQDPQLFEAALALYEARSDKEYSLTDCMSMVICRAQGITDVLTYDRHFIQEGFAALLRTSQP